MASPTVLERAPLLVEPAMAAAVDRLCVEMRLPLPYHFGWPAPDGPPSDAGSGQGLRPALAVLSAAAGGAPRAAAVPGGGGAGRGGGGCGTDDGGRGCGGGATGTTSGGNRADDAIAARVESAGQAS